MHLTLAPLHGFTDATFRKTYFRHFRGLDDAIAPFVSLTHGDKVTRLKVKDLIADKDSPVRVIPQILGNEPGTFIMMCNYLSDELGCTEVNWNLGCPVHSIVHKRRGSGMLPYPEQIAAFLDQVMPELRMRLSVKLRLGYYSVSEFPPVIRVLNGFPLHTVTVHPRIGTQMYEGEVLLEALDEFFPLIEHDWIYNGDLHSLASFEMIRKRYPGLSRFMLGRGVFLNPFLPEMIRSGTNVLPADWQERFHLFHTELEQNVRNSRHYWMSKMKEYWKYFGVFLQMQPEELRQLLGTADEQSWKARTTALINGRPGLQQPVPGGLLTND